MLFFSAISVSAAGRKDAGSADYGKLVVGFSPGASSTLPIIAVEEGYYEATGVKPEFVSFSSTADGLAALEVGKIDVGVSFGTGAPLTLATKGAKFVIIAGNQTGGHPVITKQENAAQYKDIYGFRGKTVGTPRLYTSDVVWRGALHQAGLVIGRDLEVVEFKRPVDILEAVKSGKIDVGIGSTLITARAFEAGLATPLFTNDLMPNHPCCRVVTTQEVLKNNRPALVAFIEALLLAEKKFRDDPESAVKANVNQQNFTEAYARETSLEPHVKFFIDPNTHAVVDMFNYMKDTEYLDPAITLDPHTLIDTSLYVEALNGLKKKAPSPYWDELTVRFKDWNS
jgi:NitT/TauT family transport system substrate-binding protein